MNPHGNSRGKHDFVLLPERFTRRRLPLRHPIEWDSPKYYPFTVPVPCGTPESMTPSAAAGWPACIFCEHHLAIYFTILNHNSASLSIGFCKNLSKNRKISMEKANLVEKRMFFLQFLPNEKNSCFLKKGIAFLIQV